MNDETKSKKRCACVCMFGYMHDCQSRMKKVNVKTFGLVACVSVSIENKKLEINRTFRSDVNSV